MKASQRINGIKNDIASMVQIMNKNPDVYADYRCQFNANCIQVITGLELDLDNSCKNGYAKVKKIHPLPTTEEFAELLDLIDGFIRDHESEFIYSLGIDDDGMQWFSHMAINCPDKVDKKSFKEALQAGFVNYLATGDFVQLYAMAVKYRKRVRNFSALFIGVGVLVVGAGGYYAYNRYQKNHAEPPLIADEMNDCDVIIDSDDDTDIVIYDDDLDVNSTASISSFAPPLFGGGGSSNGFGFGSSFR